MHAEREPVFNQGNLGSCTANAALGCLVTDPFYRPTFQPTEADAVTLYEAETRIDDSLIPGRYPPDDTGSTGPWSMTALQQQGRIKTYRASRHAFDVLGMLMDGPVSIGVTWFRSMFDVDPAGAIHAVPSSGVAGGHQVCLVGVDVAGQRVRIRNSWGEAWGQQGHAWLSWGDLHALMAGGGDAVQPVL